MRVATGGLAASDRVTPVSISAKMAPSNGLSTVHHHSDSGVRSSREIMAVPNGQRSVPLVEDVGYRGVNAVGNFCRGPNVATNSAVIPRACGVSSTPRLLGSISNVSGILDRPPQCAIAHKAGDDRWGYTTGFTPGSALTWSRKAAPRISKLPYWSKEAQAGDSSTTGSASP